VNISGQPMNKGLLVLIYYEKRLQKGQLNKNKKFSMDREQQVNL
jgi:hypothetical protein